MHKVLIGIIHAKQLSELRETGTAYPVAQMILRLYVGFGGDSRRVEPWLNQIEEVCFFEGPKFEKEDPMAYFYLLASKSKTKVDVRLNAHGKSICTGPTAVRLEFLVPEIVSETTARIWLLDREAVLFLELPMKELSETWTRMRFMDLETWEEGRTEGPGIEKEIMYAGKLVKGKNMRSIRHAQPSRYNMASKRVPWVIVRNDERQKIQNDEQNDEQFIGRNVWFPQISE